MSCSKAVTKAASKGGSKAVFKPVFTCPSTPTKSGKTSRYSISSIKHIRLPGDQVSTCVLEFADEADENYDHYEVFKENMDDIKTMNGRDVNLMLLLRGLSIDGTITDKKHRLRNTFYLGDSPALPTQSKVKWSNAVIVRNNLVDIDTNFTYRTSDTQYHLDELARRCMLCPKRPAISFGPGCCQKIDPSFLTTFHSLRPDLKAAPGLIEDIHQIIINSERGIKIHKLLQNVCHETYEPANPHPPHIQKQLTTLRQHRNVALRDEEHPQHQNRRQILKDHRDLNNYLFTVCSW